MCSVILQGRSSSLAGIAGRYQGSVFCPLSEPCVLKPQPCEMTSSGNDAKELRIADDRAIICFRPWTFCAVEAAKFDEGHGPEGRRLRIAADRNSSHLHARGPCSPVRGRRLFSVNPRWGSHKWTGTDVNELVLRDQHVVGTLQIDSLPPPACTFGNSVQTEQLFISAGPRRGAGTDLTTLTL